MRVSARNLFLPISLGGFGIEPPQGWKYKVSSSQWAIAYSRIFTNQILGAELHSQHPLPKGTPPLLVKDPDQPWDVMSPAVAIPKEETRLMAAYSFTRNGKLREGHPFLKALFACQLRRFRNGFFPIVQNRVLGSIHGLVN